MKSAKLILAAGSHAGLEEPLKTGYYMIGRHSECQIRPKSHSVSRRHCLIHRTEKGVCVYDLGSANGTVVNDNKLEPNQWVRLRDGDMLRCGKVSFKVAIDRTDEIRPNKPKGSPKNEPSLGSGDAWKNFDLLAFLESEDDAERRETYGEHDHRPASDSLSATVVNLEDNDEEVKQVLDEARRRKREERDAEEDHELSPRARRIAKIRARIQAQRKRERGTFPRLTRSFAHASG